MSSQLPAPEIPELTTIRFVAALTVVISHLSGLGFVKASEFHATVDGGRPAVSFFFVLSGFVMCLRYPQLKLGDHSSLRQYSWSRFARLYPTIILSLCLAIPGALYLLSNHATEGFSHYYALKGQYAAWLTLSAVSQVLCITGWVPVAAINQPWNGPAWSLSCEIFFYAILPVFLQPLKRLSMQSLAVAMAAAWLIQGAWIAMIHEFLPPNRAGFLVSQFPLTHLFEFVLGVVTGILYFRLARRSIARVTICAAAVSLAIFILAKTLAPSLPLYYGLSPLFAVSIIWLALTTGSVWTGPLRYKGAIALGHASYALYMIHIPILVDAAIFRVGGSFRWFWVPTLIGLSCCAHFLFAEPVRRAMLMARGKRIMRLEL